MNELVVAGHGLGLRVFFNGNLWRTDCHFVDDAGTKSVTLMTLPVCETWQSDVVILAVHVLFRLENTPHLCSVVVDNDVSVGCALASLVVPEHTVIMRFLDVQWIQRVILKQFKQRLGGLGPYNVLEFLQF